MSYKQVVAQIEKVPIYAFRETYKVNYPVKPKTVRDYLNLPLVLDYLAIKFLEKRKVLQPTLIKERSSYSEVVIDEVDILDLVSKCVNGFYNQYGEFPKTVLIGDKQYRELYKELLYTPDPRNSVYMTSNPLTRIYYATGVEAVLIPYMEGVLALREKYPIGNVLSSIYKVQGNWLY